MGDDVIITTVESVEENSDSERVITSLARKNDIIFTTSFGYMNPTIKVAKALSKCESLSMQQDIC